MTEFWKSNANYFCEYCGVWLQDNVQARAIHERGSKHKDNVSKRLRRAQQADIASKAESARVDRAVAKIEDEAEAKFAADKRAEEAARKARLGTWELQPASGYFYNDRQRYYFDSKSGQYYGGDPPVWTAEPKLEPEARHPEDPAVCEQKNQDKSAGEAPRDQAKPTAAAVATKASSLSYQLKKAPVASTAAVGGYQMPTQGRIGGARMAQNVGNSLAGKRSGPEPTATAKGTISTTVSAAEAAALERREAAKKRVQARTMANFGLG